ncbi:MAG: DUF1513 domain-containing protein [Rhodospirillales bacterium]|nr:DUF1513 domain-containing protein [Rhodospirillales bacterium]
MKTGFASLLSVLFPTSRLASNELKHSWVSGFGTNENTYGVVHFDENLNLLSTTETPFRLHDIAFRPAANEVCIPARRPGKVFLILNASGEMTSIQAPKGRHFYGHGAYSKDGRLLFLTENDYLNGQGVIGIYEATNRYTRTGEMSSGGIGPHEILAYGDGKHLVVANGGIRTHPESGRAKLNLDTMRPNISVIDPNRRLIVERMVLPEDMANLSIRHIYVTQNDDIYFGVQDQFPGLEDFPLVGNWHAGRLATFVSAPDGGWSSFNGYVGSIRSDKSNNQIAACSPRGGIACFWTINDNHTPNAFHLKDVCGIERTQKPNQFIMTSGTGRLVKLEYSSRALKVKNKKQLSIHFDNHCRVI